MTILSQSEIVKRLIFIRHLYNLGVAQIEGQFPAASVLCLHDAIELFMQLGIEHHNVSTGNQKHPDFILLFDDLSQNVTGLEGRDGLNRLNKTRVAVKHNAIQVSIDEVKLCRERSRVFFEVNCQRLLQVDFFSFSTADGIIDVNIRAKIQEAELALSAGDLMKCAAAVAKAFESLERTHEYFSGIGIPTSKESSLNEILDIVRKLEITTLFTALGVPYVEREKFKALVATVTTMASGRQVVVIRRSQLTPEQMQFCIDFVIRTTLAVERRESLL
jgi:hypothetical protein